MTWRRSLGEKNFREHDIVGIGNAFAIEEAPDAAGQRLNRKVGRMKEKIGTGST